MTFKNTPLALALAAQSDASTAPLYQPSSRYSKVRAAAGSGNSMATPIAP